MQKIPRYMKEFANAQIADCRAKMWMNPEAKQMYIDAINKALSHYKLGLCTVRETMVKIAYPFGVGAC